MQQNHGAVQEILLGLEQDAGSLLNRIDTLKVLMHPVAGDIETSNAHASSISFAPKFMEKQLGRVVGIISPQSEAAAQSAPPAADVVMRTQTGSSIENVTSTGNVVKSGSRLSDVPRRRVPSVLFKRWKARDQHGGNQLAYKKSRSAQFQNNARRLGFQVDSCWRDIFVANELAITMESKVDKRQSINDRNSAEVESCEMSRSAISSSSVPSLFRKQKLAADRFRSVPLVPNAPARIVWDCMGICCMLYDCVTIPVFLSWGYSVSSEDMFWYMMAVIALVFWILDIICNFNTGVLRKGTLEMQRWAVFREYVSRWFIFDFTLVILDLLMLSEIADVGGIRALRTIRLLRVFKVYKVNQALDDLCGRLGIRWLILIVAIIGNLSVIFLIAHFCTCVWYYIGRSASQKGSPSWITLVETEDNTIYFWYTKSLYWVLGHLTAAPVDSEVSPQNNGERLFTLCAIFCSILVVGSGISSMTNTIAELGKLNSNFHDTKRQLQSYLKTAGVKGDLYYRILKFAMHSYSRQRALSLDMTVLDLLSDRLKSELALNQRSKHFTTHPLFCGIQQNHAEVFRDACEAFKPEVLADEDTIFHSGRMAKSLYVTQVGEFQITCDGMLNAPVYYLREQTWISELALYSKFVHQSTLTARSFADAWTLTCNDLLKCVGMDPTCVGMVYRYAQEFLIIAGAMTTEMPVEVVSLEAATKAFESYQRASQPLLSTVPYSIEEPEDRRRSAQHFIQRLTTETDGCEAILRKIPEVFKELEDERGIYAKLEFLDERNRAACSMLSIVLMMQNRYSDFVQLQSAEKRLTPATWRQWQSFIKWAQLGMEEQHALLVFLAIRGLGKVKALGNSLPQDERSPEDIVLSLLGGSDSFVPSYGGLSPAMQATIELTFGSLKGFSLPQLLQGENTPSQIMVLQQAVEEHGEELLRFFLVCQVAIMCGLAGAKNQMGSVFMDEQNSISMLTAISCLKEVQQVQCHTAYWGFILSRANRLGLPTGTLDQVVIARLACLCRITENDRSTLEEAWNTLHTPARRRLVENFLADGIEEVAYVFTFLPMYLANAKDNPSVGWSRAFVLLYDLLQLLNHDGCEEQASSATIVVNLSDIAAFAREAPSPRIFLVTAAHVRIVQAGSEIQLLIATAHKEKRAGQEGHDRQDLTGMMRAMMMKVEGLQEVLLGHEDHDLVHSAVPHGARWSYSSSSFAASDDVADIEESEGETMTM